MRPLAVSTLVVILAILIPLVSPLLRSPIALLILSPLFAVSSCLLGLFIVFATAYALDGRKVGESQDAVVKRLRYATRSPAFATPAAWHVLVTRSSWPAPPLPPLLSSYPTLSSSVSSLISLIIASFVLPWYNGISSSRDFPQAIAKTIHYALSSLLTRGEKVDVMGLVSSKVVPDLTLHIDRFRAAETLIRGVSLSRHLTPSAPLDLLLASHYGPLHPAISNLSSLNTRQSEEEHVRKLAGKVLSKVLPPNEASEGVKIIVREVVVCQVILPLVDMLSDPDFWNRMLVDVTSQAIAQQHLISRVRHILSLSTPPTPFISNAPAALPSAGSTATAGLPIDAESGLRMDHISFRTTTKQFEGFLKSIERCGSLLDARRLKNDVAAEIRKTRTLLANHDRDEPLLSGQKPEVIVKYLDRIYTAKQAVEKRIAELSGLPSLPLSPGLPREPISPTTSIPTTTPSLRTILSSPESLGYFMEFLDRRGKSLPVKFWLTVESFKDPLESISSDEESLSDSEEPAVRPMSSQTLKEDIRLIWDLYFSPSSSRPPVSQKHVDTIRQFLETEGPSSAKEEKKVRRAVLLMQREMEKEMEGSFEAFKRGELWVKAVGESNRGIGNGLPAISPVSTPLEEEIGETRKRRVLPAFIRPQRGRTGTTSPTAAQAISRVPSAPPSIRTHSADSLSLRPKGRPSLDSTRSNLDVLIGPGPSDRAPLFGSNDDDGDGQEEGAGVDIEAIQAALTDMIADEAGTGNAEEGSEEADQPTALLGEPRRDKEDGEEAEWALAIPGDPHLTRSIDRLTEKVSALEHQSSILDALLRKAELTGDTSELNLLSKSKSALERELREVKFQREQFVMQEKNGLLSPERTRIRIVGTTIGEEEGGLRQVVKYAIEVQQLEVGAELEGEEHPSSSGWVTARRYSEFYSLHHRLKDRFPVEVRSLELPGKKLVSTTSAVVDARRIALEKYLQSLLTIPDVCACEDLRSFLSRSAKYTPISNGSVISAPPSAGVSRTTSFLGQDIMRTMYRSVAESIDDIFFGPSMLDVLIQRLTQQAKSEEELNKLPEAEGLKPLEGESGAGAFSRPICDLILAVFELNERNNWLRRQAVVIILQQVLGSTIERKMRETLKTLLEEAKLVSSLDKLKDSLFPGGKLKPPSQPRSFEEKLRTKEEANRKLSALMPDLFANMIGRSNARRGARRLFAVVQNERLNRHIIYTVMDEMFYALFPELSKE